MLYSELVAMDLLRDLMNPNKPFQKIIVPSAQVAGAIEETWEEDEDEDVPDDGLDAVAIGAEEFRRAEEESYMKYITNTHKETV